MKPASAWIESLSSVEVPSSIALVQGPGANPSITIDGVYLHSKYRPREEAEALIDSLELAQTEPVLVVGLGLGYHVQVLLERGFDVCAVECEPAVAKLALQGSLKNTEFLLAVGCADALSRDSELLAFLKKHPQVLLHPPTARVRSAFVSEIERLVARAGIEGERLGIAVVGPMYGGSLPIAKYLADAFTALGHRTLYVDNSSIWPVYQAITQSIETRQANSQLSAMLVNLAGEWSYARVAEFDPNICIVMAQAPVGADWPARLNKNEIVTAFWFVENWRHMTYWRDIASRYDYFFHIQPGEFERQLREAGCPHHAYVQTACDPRVHKPVELTSDDERTYGCDLSFAGAGYHNRNQFFQGLTDYNFKIWGVEWQARELINHVQNPNERFGPEEFAKIVAASKINLNLHSSATHNGVDPHCDAINPRVFEIAACGGFQLCDPCRGLDTLLDPETELPVYRDLPELRALIDRFLESPEERQAFADRARSRVLRDHTYEKRAQQMLDLIVDQHGSRILSKGIRALRTVGEMAERVGVDTALGRYLQSLPKDLPFTQEAINERIPVMGTKLSYPEALFSYLREMRNSSEQILAMFEGV
ncbi:MAG: glycosyltransferase [Candidatus Hydrogenedentes bacterium]|nr:glycosyltransferase [Candidatus Hydrogenedentota bacterium]